MLEPTFVNSTKPGRIGCGIPYFNGRFVDVIKSKIPGAKFDRSSAQWFFSEKYKDQVIAIWQEFFASPMVKRRLVFDLNREREVSIDGQFLIWHSRDHAKLANSPFIEQVHEIILNPGGSRANPRISGRLVIDVTMRPDAVIKPEPTEMIDL